MYEREHADSAPRLDIRQYAPPDREEPPSATPLRAPARRGVSGLAFNVYAYEDHCVVAVTREDYAPLAGARRRLGHMRIGIGLHDLRGLSGLAAVHAVALAIDDAVMGGAVLGPGASRPGAPGGATGAVVKQAAADQIPGQLRLDLPDYNKNDAERST